MHPRPEVTNGNETNMGSKTDAVKKNDKKNDIVFVLLPNNPSNNQSNNPSNNPPPNTPYPLSHYIKNCQIAKLSCQNALNDISKSNTSVKKTIILTQNFYSACDPNISFDGKTILFAGKKSEKDKWQIWEMTIDGRNHKQITHENADHVSPLYVGSLFHLDDAAPTNRIVYIKKIITTEENKTLPALYSCDHDGKNPHRITHNLYPDFDPDVLPNGRIVFSSTKRNQAKQTEKIINLLAVNNDGTDVMGYLTSEDVPGNKIMPRVSPDGRVYFIENITNQWPGGGTPAYISQRRPAHTYKSLDFHKSRRNKTKSNKNWFHSPCPMPDGSLVISYKETSTAVYKLVTINPNTGKILSTIYASTDNHCIDAQPAAPHQQVKGRSSFVEHKMNTGTFYCINAYISQDPRIRKLKPGTIKKVRFLKGDPLNPEIRHLLGTAPVEPDGSFHVNLPSQTPVVFQLLDENETILAGQASWTWVMPREHRGCIGCHEHRELTPPNNRMPIALTKPAVKLLPPAALRRPLRGERQGHTCRQSAPPGSPKALRAVGRYLQTVLNSIL